MKVRSALSILCAAALALGALSGCAAGNAASDAQSGAEAVAVQDGALIVRVQSIEGSTITAAVGMTGQGAERDGNGPKAGGNGAQGGFDAGQGGGNGQSGRQPEETPPAMPQDGASGNWGNGNPGGRGGLPFAESGETVTFTVNDATAITVQSGKEGAAGTFADIAAGDILEVVLSDDSVAETIVVRSFGMGGIMPGSGAADNGQAARPRPHQSSICMKMNPGLHNSCKFRMNFA